MTILFSPMCIFRSSYILLAAIMFFLLLCDLPCSRCHAAQEDMVDQEEAGSRNFETIGQRIQIRRLQQGISEQKGLMLENQQKETELLDELEKIDLKLHEQQQKVESLVAKVESQQQLIGKLDTDLIELKAAKAKVQAYLRKRLSAYYKMGKVGLLNVAFSTKSLPDLLIFHDSFQELIRHDEKILREFHQKIEAIGKTQKAYELEKSVLVNFKQLAIDEKESTESLKKEQENLLLHIRTQQRLHGKAVKELENAAHKLTASLTAEKASEEPKESYHFQSGKGTYHPPVEGQVITLFQQETSNAMGILKKSQGIAFDASDGAVVKAIAPGAIVYAGYLRGYGNTVVIHHGSGYFSVLSRLEQIKCHKGDTVKEGALLGNAGDTATIMDAGVYFELRKDKESLDPLEWLDNKRISIASPAANK